MSVNIPIKKIKRIKMHTLPLVRWKRRLDGTWTLGL